MLLSYPLLIVSVLWIASEITLARVAYSRSEHSKVLDRSSLRYLWITIFISVNGGICISMTGMGFVHYEWRLISNIGIALILIGLIIRWIAIVTLRKHFTVNISIQADHQLVKNGLYRYLRHPSYTGSLLSFLGLGFAFSNWLTTTIIFCPVLLAFLLRIKIEEEALRARFGNEYEQYCKETYRLILWIY